MASRHCRHCERSEAIQRRHVVDRPAALGRFAALAMTERATAAVAVDGPAIMASRHCRHCERSEANQRRHVVDRPAALGRFAALAMTEWATAAVAVDGPAIMASRHGGRPPPSWRAITAVIASGAKQSSRATFRAVPPPWIPSLSA
ncbi:hypothetical protein [Methylobacterium sp. J-076]|uniref:hypothetical protein n=1 Tax=Methylobacterium sp. J-076 TaxID=2836655 RepID=UPI001FBB8A7D|nr:hypothetical protein [Methylobacterium sp. J-076]MCJ2014689.1 hypothetical protein [Methylobacterium sp. J-076]